MVTAGAEVEVTGEWEKGTAAEVMVADAVVTKIARGIADVVARAEVVIAMDRVLVGERVRRDTIASTSSVCLISMTKFSAKSRFFRTESRQ